MVSSRICRSATSFMGSASNLQTKGLQNFYQGNILEKMLNWKLKKQPVVSLAIGEQFQRDGTLGS